MKRINISILIFISCACDVFAGIGMDVNTPKTVNAEKIEYNVKTASVKTEGKTEIISADGQRLTLNNSSFSNKGDNFEGHNIQLWLGKHIYLEGESIERQGNLTVAEDALFTACYGCDGNINAWEFSSEKVSHTLDNHTIVFKNPVLWLYDVPVLWLPYWQMYDPTVKYKSGLLLPSFGSTNKMGTLINLPVYISLSDTHDATVTFGYLTKENPLFQLEHRLNLPYSEFRTEGSFTHNKEGENRWHVFNDDIIELGDNARATIYIDRASDKTYLQKYGFYGAQPYLDSGASVEFFGQSGYAVADTHIFQELRTASGNQSAPDGDILPNVRGEYQTTPFFYETYAKLGADVLGISGKTTSAQRIIGDGRIVSPWTLWGGNRITLSLDARYDIYNFDNTNLVGEGTFSGVKSRFLPSGYVEWGLPLVRPSNGWTQIIEPRARVTVMRHIDKEVFAVNNDSAGALLTDTTLFSDNRFSGYDLWENGDYADYGVRWSAFNEKGKTVEVFLGESYDFTNKLITDENSGFHNGFSDYVGRIGYNNASWLNLASRFRFGKDSIDLRHIESDAKIGNAKNYLSIGHMWSQQLKETASKHKDIHEIMSGLGIQLTNRLSTKFYATYNVSQRHFQKYSGGLFYEHPCYYLSLEYRRDGAINEVTGYEGDLTYQFKFGLTY